ncbi:histone H3 [Spironucleus salmonicida]|uniref:Histone H3 n=1 Tax=Spironucleus salmonicida TaxID=348837 RepID=V6LLW1_9EUKA|nr:histone H3 [Spironucleus salmonicida]|eukprot:EST41689.1 Histone H3 [Spironucleus salmonicida]
MNSKRHNIPRKTVLSQSRQSTGIKRINRNSSNVLKEIYKYQSSNEFLFRRLPFARIIREIILENQNLGINQQQIEYRIQKEALDAVQTAAEAFIVELFAMAQLCAEHGGRVTIFNRDVLLTLRIRKLFV